MRKDPSRLDNQKQKMPAMHNSGIGSLVNVLPPGGNGGVGVSWIRVLVIKGTDFLFHSGGSGEARDSRSARIVVNSQAC